MEEGNQSLASEKEKKYIIRKTGTGRKESKRQMSSFLS